MGTRDVNGTIKPGGYWLSGPESDSWPREMTSPTLGRRYARPGPTHLLRQQPTALGGRHTCRPSNSRNSSSPPHRSSGPRPHPYCCTTGSVRPVGPSSRLRAAFARTGVWSGTVSIVAISPCLCPRFLSIQRDRREASLGFQPYSDHRFGTRRTLSSYPHFGTLCRKQWIGLSARILADGRLSFSNTKLSISPTL